MAATVDIVIPVYNEEQDLPRSIDILSKFLKENLAQNPWQIIIADNGSTDNTRTVADMLATRYPSIVSVHISQKGRGRALRQVWLESNADIVSYMDVDLSTDLSHFLQLVRAIEEGAHVAIGSRLSKGSKVTRSFKREFISRSYSALIKMMFFTPFRDAQCGFKAVSRNAARAVIPKIENNNWFFDTELLIIAAKGGYRIQEIPVRWKDDPDSRVKVVSTAWEDIKGLLRLRFRGVPKPSSDGSTSSP
jgi:glycosyltransferase involved in cell wall biosynthesis